MSPREIAAVSSENHTKRTNTVFEKKNAVFIILNLVVHDVITKLLSIKILEQVKLSMRNAPYLSVLYNLRGMLSTVVLNRKCG